MPATPFDSAIYRDLFPTGEVAKLFSDTAEVRAMLIVEGALAKVQGAAGVIPEISAAAIHRAALEIQLDPGGLGAATGQNGVSVPALVAAFREAMQAPEHAQYVHWGATSQDIMDTALMLRLRQVLAHCGTVLGDTITALADLAEAHAETPMAARTYTQHATPTSFGAVVAGWGAPLLTLAADLPRLKEQALAVSLSGAAGTASQLGPDPASLRADLAAALGLADPGQSWHSDRDRILQLAGWAARTLSAAGKMGEDLILSSQPELGEIRLGAAGASSTMPQKQNPVQPSALVALCRHGIGLNATLQGAALHRQQRDGAAWFTEWLAFPQLMQTLTAALGHTRRLAQGIAPDPARMALAFDAANGTIFAEGLSFALTDRMPRPDAQAEVKALCKTLPDTSVSLRQAALDRWPDLDPALFAPGAQLGSAPAEARTFVRAARARG